MSSKERLLDAVGEYCIENNILVDDIPPFVAHVLGQPIPFRKAGSKFNKTLEFDYQEELEEGKVKTVD